ncbi:DegT/DnrJ/EryC1/StrS family aminotransferase [Candidatus Latescibacterota bacterium]
MTPSRGNIPRYEAAFSSKFGCSEGVMFSHGRSGIYALLKVWGLKDTEVICPAYTCVVVPHAIVLSGNIPVFVDCEDGGFNADLDGIAQAVTEKTRVIIPTHLFGYAMDVHAVEAIARDAEEKYGHRVYVIQDCAHSYGARWQGELVSRFGDAAVFGSNISKIINSIFGGMVITNSDALAGELRGWRRDSLRDAGLAKSIKRLVYFAAVNIAFLRPVYGVVNTLERRGLLNRVTRYYDEDRIDFPDDWDQLPSEVEARVGLAQLAKYDAIIETRRRTAQRVHEEMRDRRDVWMVPYDEEATYSHIVARVEDRDAWVEAYRRRGIQLGILIEYSIPMLRAYRKYQTTTPKRANEYATSLVNFPAFTG